MIPENMKSKARAMTVAMFGVFAIGSLIAGIWVSIYAPK
jgi:hypothetical protein